MNPMTNDLEQLRGEVERLVYSSEESGFTICRLVVPGRGDLVTVVGTMPGIQPGERLHLQGRWINHPIHGYQFRADSYSSQLPASANAVRRYLASSLVKGIGPVLAGRLVDCFGDETLRVIDEQPERLAEAPGVGPPPGGEHQAGLGGAAGDTQRDAVPAGPRGECCLLHPHLQDIRPGRGGRSFRRTPTGWPRTCGGLVSSPPTRSPGRWG